MIRIFFGYRYSKNNMVFEMHGCVVSKLIKNTAKSFHSLGKESSNSF